MLKTKIGCLMLLLIPCLSHATPLDAKITAISTNAVSLQADVTSAYARLNAKADLVQNQLDHGTILVGDYVAGPPGALVALPFLLIPSTFPVTGIQADINVPVGLTIVSVTAGSSTLAAQKVVSTNTVNGLERFIIFGLNQNVIPQGEVLLLNLRIPSTAAKGSCPILIDNPIASDANGNALLMSVMSGIVEVQ